MKTNFLISLVLLFSNSLIGQADTCGCYNELGSVEGDKPIYSFKFNDDKIITICGFKEGDFISEFNVFDCSNGTSIVEYDATQNCQIKFTNNIIEILAFKNLPTKENWGLQPTEISKEVIVLTSKGFESLGAKFSFSPPIIDKKKQNEFLEDILLNKDNGLHQDWSWEEIIDKLELLSLMNNEKAENILFNIEKLTNYQFDGGVKEHYRDAIAIIKWMKK